MLYKLLLAFCLYLPFQIALNPASGVDLASSRVFIILLFFSWLAESLRIKKLVIKKNAATLLLLAFLFFNSFSLIAARNTDWSLRKLAFWLSILPLYFVIASVVSSRKKMEKMISFLVFGGAVLAGMGIVQFLAQFVFGIEAVYAFWAKIVIPPFLGLSLSEAVLQNPSWLVNISGATLLRATATFPDPHMLSFYLGMLAPLALGLFLDKRNKIFFWCFAILMIGDLLTFSRGGYLGLFSAAMLFAFNFWRNIEKKYKLFFASAVLIAIIILSLPNPISDRFVSSFNLKEGSNMGRLETWKQAIGIISANPFVGVGIGNYPLEIKPTADYREPIYAHSAYLDIAAETGVINLLIWLSLLGILFFEYLQKARKLRIFLGLALSILVFAVHSAVETAIYSPAVLSLFLIIASFNPISNQEPNSSILDKPTHE